MLGQKTIVTESNTLTIMMVEIKMKSTERYFLCIIYVRRHTGD